MTAELLEASTIDRFRAAIARWLGLRFEEARTGLLAEVLQRALDRTALTPAIYLERLDAPSGFDDELRELARELTVGETYFFRNIDQFRALGELVLPDRMAERAATRSLRVLSAGCASGEETYSLAILVREQIRDPRWKVDVLGIDINPAALEKAAAGRYSRWSLRETPSQMRSRWFHGEGRDQMIEASIRAAVRFEERNLAEEDLVFWRPEIYDVILCRNVLMYHTPQHAQAIVARFARALAPGGYLFLGHAETLRGLSQDFHLRHTHDTFYYQRKDPRDPASVALPQGLALDDFWSRDVAAAGVAAGDGALATPAGAGVVEGASTWIEAIQRATERIQVLALGGSGVAGHAPPPTGDRRMTATPAAPGVTARAQRPELAPVIESLQRERFSEALGLWHALPSESVTDPEALLLRAALLAHSGQLAAAERVCAEVLALDDLNAGAHYLLALCREGAGDRAAAIDHDQVAVYLDPAFAMPRLHLGLIARRAGQRDVARRELGLALPLLQREDAARLLLFGGGFNRDTLAALCRAELSAAGAE